MNNIQAAIASALGQIDNPSLTDEVRQSAWDRHAERQAVKKAPNIKYGNAATGHHKMQLTPIVPVELSELEREARYPSGKLNRGD